MDNSILQNKITIWYIGALSFVAILSTLSFYVLYKSLEASSSTAYIVNISGKQRMLSQHIALDLHRIHLSQDRDDISMYNSTLTKQNLLEHVKSMQYANEVLSSGKLPNAKVISLSPSVYEMYFGEMNMKERVDEYVKVAKQVVTYKKHENIDKILKQIDTNSERLLKDLNKIVQQYESEGEQKLQNLQKLELLAWILVVFTLFLEVIFIFQPIMKKMLFLITQNAQTMQNLEHEVEIRTFKLKEANAKLHEMASHDPMTGLKNRLTLENDIEIAIAHSKEHHAPFSLLMLDIDWFKDTNDTYGHDVGDSVINEISNIFTMSVREGDKVYRAGGEEFVILLNRISLADTENIAEKIRLLIEKHIFKAENEEFHKTISIGLYHSSMSDEKNSTKLLKKVDNALYTSKDNGRNRITNAI